MNTVTIVNPPGGAEPLDQTVYPRAHRRRSAGHPKAEADVPFTRPAGIAANLEGTVPPRKPAKSNPTRGDLLLYLLMAMLIWSAWKIGQMGLIDTKDDTNYWIGVIGGSMMLVLFVYPLRKYVGFMRGLGHVKWWFWFHLFMGITGPWLILVHSNFHVGSLNAGVALYSMGIVVASGVIGRFIYVRVHRGLDGERTGLHALREKAGFVENAARSRLHFAPKVEQRLLDFEQHELRAEAGWLTYLRQVTLLPAQQWITYVRCVIALRRPLNEAAKRYNWTDSDLRRRRRRARRLVDHYLNAVVRVAQYTAYERVFALWHMAHLPFIYLLVISAVAHVVAVHAY